MINVYVFGWTFFISIFITIMFFIKKNIDNEETNIFRKMLICNCLETLLCFIIVVISLTSNSLNVLKVLKRIDVILLVTWASLMFLYVYNVTSIKNDQRIKWQIFVLNFTIFLFSLFFEVDIIIENNLLLFSGPLIFLGLLGIVLYVLFMIVTMVLSKDKKEDIDQNKYLPLYFLILMIIITIGIRIMKPEIIFLPIVLNFVNLIMMFTIENPDLKMMEELIIANEQVVKANKIKSEFLSSMAHELRTPLNSIMGNCQILEYYELEDEVKDCVNDIYIASDLMLKMYTNILNTYKLETDEIRINYQNYNPTKDLNEFLDTFENKIKRKGLVLERQIDDFPLLYGDINILKRALINILDNAIKFTEKGKIIFKVNKEIERKKCHLYITIEDTGIGISSKNIKKVCQVFERGDFRDTHVNGLGLGLPLSKRLIKMLKGKLKIYSDGNGTKVVISIKNNIVEKEVEKNVSFNC